MRRMVAMIVSGAVALSATALLAREGGEVFLAYKNAPQMVRDIAPCDIEADVMRRPFAGGIIFALACPGNNANFMQALIYASREDGEGARVLDFPIPGGRRMAPKEELSNVRWNPESSEVSEIFVDPENKSVCRTEARWRIPGGGGKPRLMFWRETRDCSGKGGWSVVVGKR